MTVAEKLTLDVGNWEAPITPSVFSPQIIIDPRDSSDPRVALALEFIEAEDYHLWIKIGMILKALGLKNGAEIYYFNLWVTWSKKSSKAVGTDFESIWNDLNPNGSLSVGTLIFLAKENGWKDKSIFKNYVGSGDDRKAVSMSDLASQLAELGLMPNRVGDDLFVPWKDSVRLLRDKDDLFAYLKNEVQLDWSNKVRCGVKGIELYRHLQCVAPEFKEVSYLPHYPKIPEVYYAHGEFTAGGKFEGFLDFFRPETAEDRQFLKAALLTPFWGGPPGTRPLFNIIADSGRGCGKTTAAEKIADIAGGCINVLGTNTETLATRLLSPNARDKQIILLDNLKSDKFDWAGAEHLVTATTVSGRRLYHGEGQRLNLFTWFITVNGCSLSTDMAQRSVIIKLAKPENDPTWLTRLNAYIEEHRSAIIGDCLQLLAGPKNEIGPCSRWSTWEEGVLSVLENPKNLQELILSRQKTIDADQNDAQEIEEAIEEAIEAAGHSALDCFHISAGDINKAFGKPLSKQASTRSLIQMINEGQISRLVPNSSRKKGRGFIWNPGSQVFYDLKDKLFQSAGYRA